MGKKLLKMLNLQVDHNQKWILISLFISGLMMTYISPRITKEIISELPAEFIAAQSLVASATAFLISIIWKGKLREKAIRYFMYLITIESLCGFALGLYLTFIEYDVWLFAIASLVYSCMISSFVSKCIMAFKSQLWTEKAREGYDNNQQVIASITCIIGFLASLILMPSLKVSTFIWGITCIIDDIGWGIVYYRNRQRLKDLK